MAELFERGLFDILFGWDTQAEIVRQAHLQEGNKALPPDLQRVYDTTSRCRKVCERNQNAGSCPNELRNLRI